MGKKPDILYGQTPPPSMSRHLGLNEDQRGLERREAEIIRQFDAEARRRMREPLVEIDLEAELEALCAELD